MFETFRGDTFSKKVSIEGYTLQPDDIIHVAILLSSMGGIIYDSVEKIITETDNYVISIPATETEKLIPGVLTLEIELTYGDGFVKTQQYELIVKADGIR